MSLHVIKLQARLTISFRSYYAHSSYVEISLAIKREKQNKSINIFARHSFFYSTTATENKTFVLFIVKHICLTIEFQLQ